MTDKPIEWIGSTKEDLIDLPDDTRRKAGERLEEVMERLDDERAKYDGKNQNELDHLVDERERKSRAKFIRKHGRPPEDFDGEYELFNEVMNMERVDSLDVLTAEHQQRIDKLLAVR